VPAPRAGSLNRRVTIQSRSTGQDGAGQQLTSWSDVATVWASIEPLSGRELERAQALHSEITHQVVIRYDVAYSNPAQMAARRLNFGGRIFNIHAALETDMAHHEIALMCSEGLNQG
jgi:SPP1 family predicted phage head-tail adaptor